MQKITEWQNIDREVFEGEILPANQPAVLRGLLRDWPVVQAGLKSEKEAAEYLKKIDTGGSVSAFVGPPEIDGRFFYTVDYKGFNFGSQSVSISTALDTLVSLSDSQEPPAIALQAIEVQKVMPAFLTDNVMTLLDRAITPRIWISSPSMVAAHFDVDHNIAGVVSGRRKFTVFPPEQVSNLYIGPLLTTPGGPPVSTVDLRNPDHERFPRFAKALETAQEAVLEPGDAIFIPVMWWHSVESLKALNILVNYWWNRVAAGHHDPLLSLIHCMAIMSGLPESQRDAWREFFDCFAFQRYGDPGAHLPSDLRDVMGKLSPSDRDQVLALVAGKLMQ